MIITIYLNESIKYFLIDNIDMKKIKKRWEKIP